MKSFLIVVVLILLAIAGAATYLAAKTPSNDRTWDPPFSRLNTVAFNEDGTLTIHDLRRFSYALGTTTAREWTEVTVNPEDIESVWFFVDHFKPSTPEVGHTFISFHMKDGSAVAFSIEARREATETYSFIGGFLNNYDLQYLWGTEQDLILQRTVLKNEQLYMLPLTISHEQARGLMKEFAKETNALAASPRFYHTLTANCTNLLAKIVNKYQPGTLPYDFSWNLTGLADGYLEEQGFIHTNGLSRDEYRASHDVTIHRADIAAHASDSESEFASYVRSLLVN